MFIDCETTTEDLKGECWKDVAGYEGYYKVSSIGRVMSYYGKCGKLIHPQKDNYGGIIISLTKQEDKRQRFEQLAKLVANAFIENPNHYPHLHFKDGNKTNCRADNLEWCWHTEKMKRQYEGFRKKVHQYSIEGEYIRTFSSHGEAAKAIGKSAGVIINACRNGNGYAHGYFWCLADGDNPPDEKIEVETVKVRKVEQYTKSGKLVAVYNNIAEAGKAVGVSNFGNISRCCRGKRHTAHGFVWKYIITTYTG